MELSFLGNTYKTYLKRLTALQNRAVKLSVGAHWRDNTTNCYLQLQVLKLNELYTYEVAKFMYKYTRKNLPPSFSSFFTSIASVHTRSTRLASSQYSLYLPRYKTLTLQRNIKFQGVKIWNSVPLETKNYPSIDSRYNIRSICCQIILDAFSSILFGTLI